MSTLMESTRMGRKKKDTTDGDETTKTTTKVDVDLMRKARMVAIKRGVDLQKYIDDLLRTPIERDYSQMIQREAQSG